MTQYYKTFHSREEDYLYENELDLTRTKTVEIYGTQIEQQFFMQTFYAKFLGDARKLRISLH